MGWMMASTTIVIVIVSGFFEYYRRNNILDKPTSPREMFRPVDKWGPAVKTNKSSDAEVTKPAGYENDAYTYGGSSYNVTDTHM